YAKKDVLGGYDVGPKAARFGAGQLHDAAGARRYSCGLVAQRAVTAADHLFDLASEQFQGRTELRQHLAGRTVLAHEAQQQMLGADHGMAEIGAFLPREMED